MAEYTYTRKSESEIHDLAIKYLAGRLFTDRHLDSIEDMIIVFMPLGLMGNEQMLQFLQVLAPEDSEEPVGMIYEDTAKALSQSYNGHPIFGSMQVLDSEDLRRFATVVDELEAHRAES